MKDNNDNTSSASLHKPPYFNGKNYTYFKNRLKIFPESINPQIWRVIQEGPIRITKEENDQTVDKPMDEWTEAENNRYALNSKAINII